MAESFESFGCRYEIIDEDKKEVALVTVFTQGKLSIKRKVLHSFKLYTVVSIKGFSGAYTPGYYPGGDRRRKYVEGSSIPPRSVFVHSVTEVTIPDSVTEIGDYAFYECGLKSITIPNSVKRIGQYAFCKSRLKSIILPDSVTDIDSHAFDSCNSLEKLCIGDNISYIGHDAFNYCKAPVDLVIKEGKRLEYDALYNFYGLKSITLPQSDHTISFINCNSLESITLSAGSWLSSYGDKDFFYGCEHLKAINVAKDNKSYCSIDGVLYNKEKDTLIRCPQGKEGKVIIPPSVKKIERHAFYICNKISSVDIQGAVHTIEPYTFYLCTEMESITLPETLHTIGNSAFYGCGLKEITIPQNVKDIRTATFKSCRQLTKVTICDGVSEIGDRMFSYCAFTTITLPSSVKKIRQYPFPQSLEELNIMNEEGNVSFDKDQIFEGSYENRVQIEEYDKYYKWKNNINYLGVPKDKKNEKEEKHTSN